MSTDDEQRQQAALREYARGLSDDQWNMFTTQVRPPTDAASARQSIAAKAQQMWETPRNHNGVIGSMAAAAAARARPLPQPETEPQAPQPGFAANRAQGYAGGGTSPEPPRAPRPLR